MKYKDHAQTEGGLGPDGESHILFNRGHSSELSGQAAASGVLASEEGWGECANRPNKVLLQLSKRLLKARGL